MISEVLIVPLYPKDPVRPLNVFRLPCFWLVFYSQDYQPEAELLIFPWTRRDDVGLDFPLGSNRKWQLPCAVWLPALTCRRVTALSSPLSDSFVLAPLPVPPGCRWVGRVWWSAAWREGNLSHIVIYISEQKDQMINLYWSSFIETTDFCSSSPPVTTWVCLLWWTLHISKICTTWAKRSCKSINHNT